MIYEQDVAFAGMKADAGFDRVESFPAAGDVPFGVVIGKNTDGAVVPGAGEQLAGVSLHSHNYLGRYTQYDDVSTMTRGLVWMAVVDGGSVTNDGPVQFNGSGRVGDAAGTAYPNAAFRSEAITRTDGNVIACVELHSPIAQPASGTSS
ncbi:hypothetical protein C7446_2563 [Kushneria sinocarnis]|uniref:Uncharacterized protein n=1 Tax=Kushneria sinocarnis TaxID=595502 RepID=A0A420WUN0_9GAMM|nr:hypothetical protein [Kushneria sinocarnis]RKQ97143.1 hypothetical protein C7446_2563 [Kushneria sinocarnis]